MTRELDNSDAAHKLELHLAEQDAAEHLAGALADSDTAVELLEDHARDDHGPGTRAFGRRRLLLGLLGLIAVALGSARRSRRQRR